MSLLLYPHGGSGNHGCEALVRSTVKLTGAKVILASSAPNEDRCYGLDGCCRVIDARTPLKRLSWAFLHSSFRRRTLGDREALDKLAFRPLIQAAQACEMALSIGGDNYCYGDQDHLYLVNRELRKRGVKTILWGCSIIPDSLRGKLLEDLQGYDRIIARESLSWQALRAAGFDRVELFPDPAFALDRKASTLPEGFLEGNTVGVNVSPMVLSCQKGKDTILQGYTDLIGHIIRNTDMQVALIPHVVWWHNDDRKPLKTLYERFKESGRVVMVEDRPAEELKDIIARCRFLVAARTHACIAAYSTYVPTLALSYSIKADGIAQDIFGPDHDPYTLQVQTLERPADLTEAFRRILDREKEIREHLTAVMPDYIGKLERLHP